MNIYEFEGDRYAVNIADRQYRAIIKSRKGPESFFEHAGFNKLVYDEDLSSYEIQIIGGKDCLAPHDYWVSHLRFEVDRKEYDYLIDTGREFIKTERFEI